MIITEVQDIMAFFASQFRHTDVLVIDTGHGYIDLCVHLADVGENMYWISYFVRVFEQPCRYSVAIRSWPNKASQDGSSLSNVFIAFQIYYILLIYNMLVLLLYNIFFYLLCSTLV